MELPKDRTDGGQSFQIKSQAEVSLKDHLNNMFHRLNANNIVTIIRIINSNVAYVLIKDYYCYHF